jgi:hypothetical protein
MSLDLVCAYCSGLVEQGRCERCRAARDQLRADRQLPAGLFLVLALLALLLAALLTH